MKIFPKPLKNQKGSTLFIAIIALISLTLLGIMAISNTMSELRVSGNDRLSKLAFFTTEAARGYVVGHAELYNFNNTSKVMKFPDDSEGTDTNNTKTIGSDEFFCLDGNPPCNQAFRGTVEYLSAEDTKKYPPRGSGFSVGAYSANVYQMKCEGYFKMTDLDNLESKTQIEQGFYRIGL
ncbi:MAG: pilus assembly PilX N-terminal domain-containing protein [Desulfobacterales bacterium]